MVTHQDADLGQAKGSARLVAEQLSQMSDKDLALVLAQAAKERPAVQQALLAEWSSEAGRTFGSTTSGIAVPRRAVGVILSVVGCCCLVTVLVAYFASAERGRVTDLDFFISSAIDTRWAHRIGGVGLGVSAIGLVFIGLVRFCAVSSLAELVVDSAKQKVRNYNMLQLCTFLASAFGIIGVALFNVSFNVPVHMMFALLSFGGMLVACCLNSRIDFLLIRQPLPGEVLIGRVRLYLRVLACVAGTIGLLGFGNLYLLGFDQLAGALELLIAFALALYFGSWACGSQSGFAVGIAMMSLHQRHKLDTIRGSLLAASEKSLLAR